MRAGFTLNFNDFGIEEQQLISYATEAIRIDEKKRDTKLWSDFLKSGFEAVAKSLSG